MRYTVLTYIFNGYERVHEIRKKDPDADYVLVTDDPHLTSETWFVIYDPMPRYSAFAKCYQVRFHPFRYAGTPIIVRVDGSIGINKPLKPIVDEFERGKYDRCLMIHPHRNTLPDEYNVWCRTRGFSIRQAAKCMKALERMGYDLRQQGLYQGCFEVLRNNYTNTDINDLTFALLCLMGTGSIERIDQTITSAIINRFYSNLKVLPVSEDIITDGDLMTWYFHNSGKAIPQKTDLIAPIFCGKPVTCFQPNRKRK